MKWTKLKQLLEMRFAPNGTGRLHLQTTRYCGAHDEEGEIILAPDGEKIYGTSFYRRLKEKAVMRSESGTSSEEELDRKLDEGGIVDQVDLLRALFASLSQSVEEMLSSLHPLVRGLAIVDTRYGRRRLSAFDPESEHELVRRLYDLRQGSASTVIIS